MPQANSKTMLTPSAAPDGRRVAAFANSLGERDGRVEDTRHYERLVEAMQSAKQLMLDTMRMN